MTRGRGTATSSRSNATCLTRPEPPWAYAVLQSRWDHYGNIMRRDGLRYTGYVIFEQWARGHIVWPLDVRIIVIDRATNYWRAAR